MQAYRPGRRRRVLFAVVAVGTMVERGVAGANIPVPYSIRAADAQDPDQMQQEIREVQGGIQLPSPRVPSRAGCDRCSREGWTRGCR